MAKPTQTPEQSVTISGHDLRLSLSRRALRQAFNRHGYELPLLKLQELGLGTLSRLVWVACLAHQPDLAYESLASYLDDDPEGESQAVAYVLERVPTIVSVFGAAGQAEEGKGTAA